mgnify:CR=1 FL=1
MAGIKRLNGETDKEYWERVGKIVDGLDCLDTRNGQIIARYPLKYRIVPFAVDELTGFLSNDYEAEDTRDKAMREKYAVAN